MPRTAPKRNATRRRTEPVVVPETGLTIEVQDQLISEAQTYMGALAEDGLDRSTAAAAIEGWLRVEIIRRRNV